MQGQSTAPTGAQESLFARYESVIWAAGFFDGEGCVSIVRQVKYGKAYHWLDISVYQNHSASLALLRELFGGSVRPEQNAWKWRACGPTAGAALREMLPYLRVKRGQAAVAVSFQARKLPARGPKRAADFDPEPDERDYALVRDLKKVVI
jgi:hypothetical protein